jgi:hypothetical protein
MVLGMDWVSGCLWGCVGSLKMGGRCFWVENCVGRFQAAYCWAYRANNGWRECVEWCLFLCANHSNRQLENGEYMFACKHQVLASQLGFACFQAAFASAINRLKGSLKTD